MSTKRKYPKAFYDDGIGDMLEWLDDEVLVHSEDNKLSSRETKVNKKSKNVNKKVNKKTTIYGENNTGNQVFKPARKLKFKLEDEDENKVIVDKRLEDRVRGLINRLAAQTMPFVTSELEKLYSTNQGTLVTAAIFNNIESSIINEHALAKRKLVAELMLLVSYLNLRVGQIIGASIVHQLMHKFEILYQTTDGEGDQRLNNIILCMVSLYTTGLINANIIFELTKRICSDNFKPKSLELLLLIIKSVGFQLRKESTPLMKQLIIMSQDRCKTIKTNPNISTKLDYMSEALSAIKNNNLSKINNYGSDIDKDTIESTMKSLIQRTKLPQSLSDAKYEEIVLSSNWYLLETRLEDQGVAPDKQVQDKFLHNKKDKVICKALGLNKPSEQTIFSALLRASDYVEASNVIIGFGLNHCSDAMLVCLHVAIHEKKYNQFYFNLINNLCKFNRKYKMAAKFAIQDKIRVLSQMKIERVEIFKVLCFELVKSDAIPITILKSIEWADISTSTKAYLIYLLESISSLEDVDKKKIMSKIDRKSSFAGAMRTFTNCFLEECKLFK